MIKIFKTFVICILALFIVGCATIVSKTKWPITINSNPSGAKIEITDKNGNSIFTGTTPATLKLKSSAGFFIPQSYTIKLSMDNYNEKTITINSTINGWYLGNLLFGGLLGLLIIDPLTGAMYRIDKDIIKLIKKYEKKI